MKELSEEYNYTNTPEFPDHLVEIGCKNARHFLHMFASFKEQFNDPRHKN